MVVHATPLSGLQFLIVSLHFLLLLNLKLYEEVCISIQKVALIPVLLKSAFNLEVELVARQFYAHPKKLDLRILQLTLSQRQTEGSL